VAFFVFPFVFFLLGLVETFIHFSSNTLKRQVFCRFLSKKISTCPIESPFPIFLLEISHKKGHFHPHPRLGHICHLGVKLTMMRYLLMVFRYIDIIILHCDPVAFSVSPYLDGAHGALTCNNKTRSNNLDKKPRWVWI
jgi:hypothetical protein